MATFEVTGPDGNKYRVEAPEGATEQDVLAFVQSQVQPRPEVGALEGTGRAFVQGGTAGTGDEIVAAGVATRNWLGNALGMPETFGSVPDRSWNEVYNASLANQRNRIESFRESDPLLAYGAEIGGAIIPSLATPMVGSAVTLPGRMALGAGNAAGQATVYGFNQGEGGVVNRLRSGGEAAMYAAPIGAAMPAAGALAQRLTSRFLERRAAQSLGTTRPAMNIAVRLGAADDVFGGPGAQRLADAGPDAMLADAGVNFAGALDTAMQTSGPAATIGRNAIEQRVNQAGQTVNQALDAALGPPQGLRDTARGIAQSTAGVRDDAYRNAYAQAINYASDAGRKIEEVVSRIPRSLLERAIGEANDDMIANGIRNQQIMAQIADDGTVTFREMLNVQQLDEIKKALQRIGYSDTDQFGRPTGAGNRARMLATQLRSALGEAVPEYNAATAAGGDKIALDNALELGSRLLRQGTTREVVAEAVRDMSPAERAMVATGVRSQLDEVMANVRAAMTDANMDAREAAAVLRDMSSRAAQEKVALVLGDAEAGRLFQELNRARMAFELRAAVSTNSRTFARGEMSRAIQGQTDDGVINAAMSGQVLGRESIIPRAIQNLTGYTAEGKQAIQDETYAALVQLLTGPRGQEALNTLLRLQQVQQATRPVAANVGRYTSALLRPLAAPLGAVPAP